MDRTDSPAKRQEAIKALKDARHALLDVWDGLDLNTPESSALAAISTEIRFQLGRMGVDTPPRNPL